MGNRLELVIGGRAQGKSAYARKKYPHAVYLDERDLTEDGSLLIDEDKAHEIILWDHFHLCVRTWQEAGMTMDGMQDKIADICKMCRHLVIISDEVGNGVVPLQKEDRIYRELVGNLLIEIASKAERVDRIICQIPQQIK